MAYESFGFLPVASGLKFSCSFVLSGGFLSKVVDLLALRKAAKFAGFSALEFVNKRQKPSRKYSYCSNLRCSGILESWNLCIIGHIMSCVL